MHWLFIVYCKKWQNLNLRKNNLWKVCLKLIKVWLWRSKKFHKFTNRETDSNQKRSIEPLVQGGQNKLIKCIFFNWSKNFLPLFLLPCFWKVFGSELFLPISAMERINGRWILLPPFSPTFGVFFWFWWRCRINIVSTNFSFRFSSSCLLATIVSTTKSKNQLIKQLLILLPLGWEKCHVCKMFLQNIHIS